ncbi:uncharacterized protein LOC142097170 isoform X2 [Mixophyes fleayi]|uniref:uncharacterized protein LOC142097170 isoform X2 n=1 Tax=Mixophyes fleayi TaxID=3061075 RepID=UPI003F4E376B
MDIDAKRYYIQNFSLDNCTHGSQGYNRVLLQLFGYTGHGKSTFINSCKYVVDNGPYEVYARVAESVNKPETMIRNSYQLTRTITLVDNRGCVTMNKDETGEICAQLGNFPPLDTEVKWFQTYADSLTTVLESERNNQFTDFIIPVFVYSAKKLIAREEAGELKALLDMAKKITGILPTVVLTNKLSVNLHDITEKFRVMGVQLFPLENYTEKDHVRTREKHGDLIKCLHEIIKEVEFNMKMKRDPVAERIDRKRILCQLAHDRDMEKLKEEMMSQNLKGKSKRKTKRCTQQ